jgi:RNA polymerase sigma-32 factor
MTGTGTDQELEDAGFQILEADEQADDQDEGKDEGPVVDMGGQGLVKRDSVTLADEAGEWVKAKAEKDTKRFDARSRDLYQAFVREATSYDRLTEEQERALGLKVREHQDTDAAKKLVVHNLRLAIKMAHQYRRAWANLMDLVQEASTGMAIAAQKWDPDQGTRYGTYAAYWIRAQLTKFLMTHGRLIHTGNTRAGRKLFHQLPRIRRQLLAAGQEPTIDAIAAEVNETPEEVARIVQRLDAREASLSAPVGDEAGSTLGDMVAGEGYDPEVGASQREMQALMEGLIQRFGATLTDERDIAIWSEHLLSTEPTSLVALGKRFGVSKQRMGQLATRLKRAFRRHIVDELGPEASLRWLFDRD